MKINKKLLSFFEKILGRSKEHNNGNFSFKCPWKNHRKSRLWINFLTGDFQCFACQDLRGRDFFTLLKKIDGSKYQFEQLKEIINNDNGINYQEVNLSSKNNDKLKLPDGFWPLIKKRKTIEYKNALSYIKNKRNISWDKIKKYNIGYTEKGKYSRRIIIPSYDKKGNLNYFVTRTYYENKYLKYKNPQINRNNIVPFELYISWNIPLIIVEGMFDAISIDYNCVPLLGKMIPNKLIEECVKHDMPYIYLILDGDAISDYFSVITRFRSNDINVKPIFLEENNDPSDLSNNDIFIKCKEAEIVDEKTLLHLKMINRKII